MHKSEDKLYEIIKDLKTKKEFEEAKEQLIGQREVLTENSNTTAIALLQEEIAGEASEFYNYPNKISKLKIDGLKKLSRLKDYSFIALSP